MNTVPTMEYLLNILYLYGAPKDPPLMIDWLVDRLSAGVTWKNFSTYSAPDNENKPRQ